MRQAGSRHSAIRFHYRVVPGSEGTGAADRILVFPATVSGRRLFHQAAFPRAGYTYIEPEERIDLTVDPPPDIVVEVVVTHPSLSKFPICAALGVQEIWSYDGGRLRMFRLSGSEYTEIPSSGIIPELEAKQLTDFLELGKTMDSVAWPDEVLEPAHPQ